MFRVYAYTASVAVEAAAYIATASIIDGETLLPLGVVTACACVVGGAIWYAGRWVERMDNRIAKIEEFIAKIDPDTPGGDDVRERLTKRTFGRK